MIEPDVPADAAPTDEVPADTPAGPSALEGVRRRWSTLALPLRILIVVGAVVGLGVVAQLLGSALLDTYTRRLERVDPLDTAFEGVDR